MQSSSTPNSFPSKYTFFYLCMGLVIWFVYASRLSASSAPPIYLIHPISWRQSYFSPVLAYTIILATQWQLCMVFILFHVSPPFFVILWFFLEFFFFFLILSRARSWESRIIAFLRDKFLKRYIPRNPSTVLEHIYRFWQDMSSMHQNTACHFSPRKTISKISEYDDNHILW